MIRPGLQWAAVVLLVCAATPVRGETRVKSTPQAASQDPYLLPSPRTHHTGYLKFQVTNDGAFSAGTGVPRDPCTALEPNAGISYIYRGGIWVGGVVGTDTLVTQALDDVYLLGEFTPLPPPEGEFGERTRLDSLKRPGGFTCPPPIHDPLARSDQDLEVTYTDTVVGWMYQNVNPSDNRPHLPLHLSVKQLSSSWSSGYGEDITIIDYQFTNMGPKPIHDAYVGVFVDHDIGSFDDDWVGFVSDVSAGGSPLYRDTLNLVWCADNDGDPEEGAYGRLSPVRALGIRWLRTPQGVQGRTFNWWVEDWMGPRLRRNAGSRYPCDGCWWPDWNDVGKYLTMANGEIDYNQNESALDHQADGWLPPVTSEQLQFDIADGFDGRFLLSAGPFDLPPGATEPLTLAVVAGRDFHVDPGAFARYWDPLHPQYHAERLDYDGVISTARWAGYLFDTPGLDTDGDGLAGAYRVLNGDTVFYSGDGIPDFLDPPPPPAPVVRAVRTGTTLTLRWNGESSETFRDPFLQRPDFEGYRVYMSRSGAASDFALLSQRDLVDYLRYEWDAGAQRWRLHDTPYTLDSLQTLYGSLSAELGFPFHPDSFDVADLSHALCVTQEDARDPHAQDTACYYFEPFVGNLTVDDTALEASASAGVTPTAVIRRVYPWTDPDEVWHDGERGAYRPWYEYEFVLTGVYVALPLYVAVTAFDFGNPQFGLAPQEGSPAAVQQLVSPGFDRDVLHEVRPQPGLYPNPYRLADDYAGQGWENPRGTEPDPERARRITFFNLPDPCTVSIWTLDGDLVRKLNHESSAGNEEVWNLITRNGERVRTGLYIWSVESRFGTDVGKLAILR